MRTGEEAGLLAPVSLEAEEEGTGESEPVDMAEEEGDIIVL